MMRTGDHYDQPSALYARILILYWVPATIPFVKLAETTVLYG